MAGAGQEVGATTVVEEVVMVAVMVMVVTVAGEVVMLMVAVMVVVVTEAEEWVEVMIVAAMVVVVTVAEEGKEVAIVVVMTATALRTEVVMLEVVMVAAGEDGAVKVATTAGMRAVAMEGMEMEVEMVRGCCRALTPGGARSGVLALWEAWTEAWVEARRPPSCGLPPCAAARPPGLCAPSCCDAWPWLPGRLCSPHALPEPHARTQRAPSARPAYAQA